VGQTKITCSLVYAGLWLVLLSHSPKIPNNVRPLPTGIHPLIGSTESETTKSLLLAILAQARRPDTCLKLGKEGDPSIFGMNSPSPSSYHRQSPE